MRLLARRAHSRAELRRKLGRRGYDGEDIAEAIARLEQQGYVDDAAFAAAHVRRRGAGLGPLALASELAARGVDRRLADAALDGFDRGAQVAAATHLVERLCARGRPAGYRELLNSVGPKLVRRGFSAGVVRDACRTVWSGTGAGSEP